MLGHVSPSLQLQMPFLAGPRGCATLVRQSDIWYQPALAQFPKFAEMSSPAIAVVIDHAVFLTRPRAPIVLNALAGASSVLVPSASRVSDRARCSVDPK
jgi:hypothetical protein